ncbi:tryptophan halogenase [Pseudoalteromonas ruthenica]|uniref:tryptophan halogenase family protein n=1 Tax=Pseudoalteromonas ruthenica TaxID=151081 RepID=UPI0011085A39|nr:tryptophan halogenase family protein [Pseudoalteromonas ruthenica]TLX52481.1 tryptophan halogenase [Pseudoalteromonas ruthenica]
MANINRVVILGGGTAGWLSAALLAKMLGKQLSITLVESSDIGTVGVGEATIPPIVAFNNALGIDEKTLIQRTGATIKLGIQFENWGRKGDSYMHAFGHLGKALPFCDFHHLFHHAKEQGLGHSLWDYSLNFQAAKAGRFAPLRRLPNTQLAGTEHAYHFDASLYAQLLRERAEHFGVQRIDAKVDKVEQSDNGDVEALVLQSGERVEGDLFIDCSGQRALLIAQTLGVGFEDWSHWLPCDRAIAVQSHHGDDKDSLPYTRSIAHDSGWQWQIPLQHRVGNGLVYCSRYLDDDQAKAQLLANLPGEALHEPRVIPFRTGARRQQWHKNVVAIGLSSGFLEPLESTSIHLIQTAVIRLLKHFPHQGIAPASVRAFNRLFSTEMAQIRDFIILHYALNQRQDSRFWRYCADMELPPSLSERIAQFQQSGQVHRYQDELFAEVAWQQVLIGQNCWPQQHHPLAEQLSNEQLDELLQSLRTLINQAVQNMPSHQQFIQRNLS